MPWLIVVWMAMAPVPVMLLILMFLMFVSKIMLVAFILVGPVGVVLAIIPVVIVMVPRVVNADLYMLVVRRCSSSSGAACGKGRRQEKCCYV